ncbi:MAG: sodium:solute symporter [Acidibacillus sp.]|nr:sodium:solute symporter [Acidibacillus sp.]
MVNWSALSVFIIFFVLVTVIGFLAARFRRGNLSSIDEWGLGGRQFGTLITWFLLGGDLYTAYTFIAIPALMYTSGATGFFAVPYTIIIYPFVFVVMPRLWSVSKKHGFATSSDFVRGRFDSSLLALAIAVTGILATMPYIALQLVGMKTVIEAMGVNGELPLILALVILAAYSFLSGLRAPAMIAIVKDIMIYITIIAAVIIIPERLGGFAHIFHVADAVLKTRKPVPGALVIGPKAYSAYATLALGSALALFLYPHSVTGILSSKGRGVIKRNAAFLPAYSFILGFIALLGIMAIAAGVHTKNPNMSVPLLLLKEFPGWFAGFAFSAIAIGALVPASIMSIAAGNLFTRNIFREYISPNTSTSTEAMVAKVVTLVVQLGALLFIVALPATLAINFQLLGGIWILQTLPALIFSLYTRWFHRYALLLGWLSGMAVGTWMAIAQNFKSSVYALHFGHTVIPGYAAVWALIANVIVLVVFSLFFHALRVHNGNDMTKAEDYEEEHSDSVLA